MYCLYLCYFMRNILVACHIVIYICNEIDIYLLTTKNSLFMKKTFLLLFVVFTMLNVACTKNDVSEIVASPQSFDEDLSSYVSKQKDILGGLRTRSTSITLSREEIAAIAIKMDSVTLKFYNDHPKFVNSLPKVSEEQLEILKENSDSLLTFVRKNYSEEIFNIVNEDIGENRFVLLEPTNLSNVSNVQHEKFIKANIEINREFKTIITDNSNLNFKPLIQETNKSKECYAIYKNKVDNCYSTMVRNLVLASVGVCTGPISGAVLSISLLYIASDYNQCLYNAAEFYKLCNGKN